MLYLFKNKTTLIFKTDIIILVVSMILYYCLFNWLFNVFSEDDFCSLLCFVYFFTCLILPEDSDFSGPDADPVFSSNDARNFPRSEVRNYSRTDVGNFPSQTTNERDFSRYELKRTSVPEYTPAHNDFPSDEVLTSRLESAPRTESGRDLNLRKFSGSEFENRRVIVETDLPEPRASERGRVLPPAKSAAEKVLTSAETLVRRVVDNFINKDPTKPIVLNLSDLEIGLELSRILSRDIRLFVGENKNFLSVRELAKRFGIDLTVPDDWTSRTNVDDYQPRLSASDGNCLSKLKLVILMSYNELDALHEL